MYVKDNQLCFGQHLRVSFQRTVRVPEGTLEFPLPPSFGSFPVQLFNGKRLDKSVDSLCDSPTLEAVIPMRPQEALWFGFEGTDRYPHAVMIGAGEINVLTGERWDESLSASPQNYIICPDQPWLDGINAGDGFVRQFVATPLGSGLALEEQLGARELTGGIRITVFGPKSELLPAHAPPTPSRLDSPLMEEPAGEERIALGAGGKIRQQIYPDPYGVEVWDTSPLGRAFIHLLNSAQYRALTGLEAPPTPIDAQTYANLGLPWFELDERDDLLPAERLTHLKTVGSDEEGDKTSDIDRLNVRRLRRDSTRVDE